MTRRPPSRPLYEAQPVENTLFYGDNLDVLRQSVGSGTVDLVYLDPPFNSSRIYNVGFASAGDAAAQIQAFDDTWTWSNETSQTYDFLVNEGGLPRLAAEALAAVRVLLRESPMTAYMVAMTPRLVELHRVLKDTGSLYLHCDPTASHYLKVTLDAIFGATNFRNEIIWRRTGAHGKVRRFGPTHDVILFYTKSNNYKWRGVRQLYMRGHVEEYFLQDEEGWRTNYYGNVLTGSGLRNGESGKPWRGVDPSKKGRHWAIPGQIVEDCGEDFTGMTQHQKLDRLMEMGYIHQEPGTRQINGPPSIGAYSISVTFVPLGTSKVNQPREHLPPLTAETSERSGERAPTCVLKNEYARSSLSFRCQSRALYSSVVSLAQSLMSATANCILGVRMSAARPPLTGVTTE